jgi:hypothetical protein
MRLISFSLWNENPVFTVGAGKNIMLAAKWFPDWMPIIYHDNTVPKEVVKFLGDEGAILEDMTGSKYQDHKAMWRFLALDRPDCTHAIMRDCDSRLSEREAGSVNQWLMSGYPFHIIRDHPWHECYWPINAGMWGSRRDFLPQMEALIRLYRVPSHDYGYDQTFLEACIWPKAKQHALIHSPVRPPAMAAKGWAELPKCRDAFIGERFDDKDNPNTVDRNERNSNVNYSL